MIQYVGVGLVEPFKYLMCELTANTIILCENDVALNTISEMFKALTEVDSKNSDKVSYYSDDENDTLVLTVDEPYKKVYVFNDIQTITIVCIANELDIKQVKDTLSEIRNMKDRRDLWFVQYNIYNNVVDDPIAFSEFKGHETVFNDGFDKLIRNIILGRYYFNIYYENIPKLTDIKELI